MKIILSRKGFDSSYGGVPGPIIEDVDGAKRLYSLPIPLNRSTTSYADIQWNGTNLHALIKSLREGRAPVNTDHPCFDRALGMPDTPHLDPDLVPDALNLRLPGWRPIFGQSGAQETQLRNMSVNDPGPNSDCGDRPLFLFFGWYRQVRLTETGFRYVTGSPDLHAIFGWLQVERKVSLNGRSGREQFMRQNPWAARHPHVACDYYDDVPNAVYLAPEPGSKTDRLILDGQVTDLPAAGMFRRYVPEVHDLTWSGICPLDQRRERRTHWRLPAWFYRNGEPTLGMHKNLALWTLAAEGYVHLVSVARGQEFVLDTKDYDAAVVAAWGKRIISAGQGS